MMSKAPLLGDTGLRYAGTRAATDRLGLATLPDPFLRLHAQRVSVPVRR
jgi:hypothetical protein